MSVLNYIKLPLLNLGILSIPPDNSRKVSYLQYGPIEEDNFVSVCQRHRLFPVLFKAELQLAGKHEEFSSKVAQSAENGIKNRNKDILPYDYNRVILETDEECPSDYINASHVSSLISYKNYIVTQGPTEETIIDFWRMVWQQKVCFIVMLTKCFDFTKNVSSCQVDGPLSLPMTSFVDDPLWTYRQTKMCSQYWPIHETESYGPFTVQIVSTQELANYTMRTLKLWRTGFQEEEEREILHCYYTEWPCYTEAFIPALLDFRRRIRQTVSRNPLLTSDRTLIHCSDGAGRSGVYIAIDANLDLLEKDGLLDIFGYLRKLKAARPGLVETDIQLKYVYDALEEYMMCKQTWFAVSELPGQIRHKADHKVTNSKIDAFRREYQLICRLTPTYTIGDCAGSYRMENRMKNRDISVITPDNFRPYLTSYQGTLDTDYINAVFVDTFNESKGCIITEWPLADTTSFFWSLIYDYNVTSVVVLVSPENQQVYPPFWPDGHKSETYGPVFSVNQLSHSHFDYIKSWIFEINKKIISLTDLMTGVKAEPKKCQFFQVTNWPMGEKTPSCPSSLVDLMILVDRWRNRAGSGPTVILSHDGRSRVGIISAAMSCVEQIKQHGEVDIFTAVRTLRRYRPRIMPNMTEYKYAYEVVLHYVLHCLRMRININTHIKELK